MPELPEVETTRRGIADIVTGTRIEDVIIRNRSLRWPVPEELPELLRGQRVLQLERRAKYLLFRFEAGTLIVHLGMSGSLRLVTAARAVEKKHDHIDLILEDGRILRYKDPRRFGCMLWQAATAGPHKLLAELGPEPLSDAFDAGYLSEQLSRRGSAVKLAIMDQHVVVGVGNIYASEALFRSAIHPERPANSLKKKREIVALVAAIKATLSDAIAAGGTTLRDYVDSTGNPGYFFCCKRMPTAARMKRAASAVRRSARSGRASAPRFFCRQCQK